MEPDTTYLRVRDAILDLQNAIGTDNLTVTAIKSRAGGTHFLVGDLEDNTTLPDHHADPFVLRGREIHSEFVATTPFPATSRR